LANQHTSSTLDAETSGLLFRSNQVSWPLAYSKHGYAGLVGLKSLVLKAMVPPLDWEILRLTPLGSNEQTCG